MRHSLPYSLGNSLTLRPSCVPHDLDAVADVYLEAFPPEERRPLPALRERLYDPNARFYQICWAEQPVGLLHLWELPSVVFCEHFALRDTARGQGAGAQVLGVLLKSITKPLLLEVEPPDTPLRARRLDFYRRLGLHVVEKSYHQPQYVPSEPPVPLYLMASQPTLQGVRLHRAVQELFRFVYNRPYPVADPITAL